MSSADPFHLVRNELDALAAGRYKFSLAAAHVLVDQAAAIISAVVGRLPLRSAEHLARATAAAASNTLPKFIGHGEPADRSGYAADVKARESVTERARQPINKNDTASLIQNGDALSPHFRRELPELPS